MNSKTFRRNHGTKARSTSSTFISLHFNKADEEQLEISYKDLKKTKEEDVPTKSNFEVSQSNFMSYTADKKSSVDSSDSLSKESSSRRDGSVASGDSLYKSYYQPHASKQIDFIYGEDEASKRKFSKATDGQKNNENVEHEVSSDFKQNEEASSNSDTGNTSAVNSNSELKLSPAIEASELDVDIFNNYINDELEKAKCEIFDTKKDLSSLPSKKDLQKESYSSPNLRIQPEVKESEKHVDHQNDNSKANETNKIQNILQKSIKFINFARNNVKFHIFVSVIACLCAPIPSWLSGFLVGTIISSTVVYWLYKPPKSKKNQNFSIVLPGIYETEKLQESSGILKGWMNELPPSMNYNPEKYHVSCTRSIYVRLDGSYLRFSFPQKNISKRAMFNEPRHELQFIYQQHYDITDTTVELLPKGLANKRLWSKKYPICLRIPNSKENVLSKSLRMETSEASFSSRTNKRDNPNRKFLPRINEDNEIVIYLFARTNRDKNVWYQRFQKASRPKVPRSHSPTLSFIESDSTLENKRTMSVDFASLHSNSYMEMEQPFYGGDETDSFVELSISKQQKFEMYLSSLLHMEHPIAQLRKDKKDAADKKGSKTSSSHSNLMWLNVLIGRLGFDILIEDIWAQLITERIQKKLNRIKLPFFLTELMIKDINLGSALPKIHRASDPSIDERGLWIDVDVSYNGSFHMTLETKINLRRFKTDSEEFWTPLSDVSRQDENSEQPVKSSVYNSEEDSMESSSDDEASPDLNEESLLKDGSRSQKFLKFIDKISQSPYFQHATKNKYIKRAMDDISNTPLVLTVEVQWLTGTLAINIPPWPTDRLWYGFRTNPSLSITARPKLGQHVVTFTQVTEWIEKKLVSEFQKLLVMPNMDDLIIPIMQSSNNIYEA